MTTGTAEPRAGRGSRPPRIAICIATHRRPAGLARLLGAIDALRLPEPAPVVHVWVVDNDADESARTVCREAASWLGFPLTYATEKRRGIPQARNALLALAMGSADLVAFLDDDSEPAPDWLACLLRALDARDADAVTGPSVSRFEEPPPAWIAEGGLFDRTRFAEGATLAVAFTGNVMVRTRALAGMDALFDERLALSGGSDVEFFRRFARAGHRIVWTNEAVVTEWVPPERTRTPWLLRRSLRVGTSTAYVERLHADGARVALRLVLHGTWCIAKGTALLARAAGRGRAAAVPALRLAVYGAGRIAGAFGVLTRAYGVTDGR